MEDKKKKKDLNSALEGYLGPDQECQGEECVIKTDKSLVEKINKKIITEDGRQLLF
jgi:hypothetical protein